MPDVLTDRSPEALLQACEENIFALPRLWTGLPGVEIRDGPDLLRYATPVPFPLMNGVMRTRVSTDAVKDVIKETEDYFSNRNRALFWWVEPRSRPADLGDRLEAAGFELADELVGMVGDLRTPWREPTPEGLAIEPVTDEEGLEVFLGTAQQVYGMPEEAVAPLFNLEAGVGFGPERPWQRYVGYLEGEPVATSVGLRAAGVVGVYAVTTLPQARGRGIGTTMTGRVLEEGQADGYRFAVLHSTEMGHGLYRRMGFQEVGRFRRYVWAPP